MQAHFSIGMDFCQKKSFRLPPTNRTVDCLDFWTSGFLAGDPSADQLVNQIAELAPIVEEDLSSGLVNIFPQVDRNLLECRVALFAWRPAHFASRLGFRISRQFLVDVTNAGKAAFFISHLSKFPFPRTGSQTRLPRPEDHALYKPAHRLKRPSDRPQNAV